MVMESSSDGQLRRRTAWHHGRFRLAVGVVGILVATSLVATAHAADDSAAAGVSPRRAPACPSPYVVVNGDSWWGVARKVGVSMDALLSANAAVLATPMYVGTTICMPAGALPTTTSTTTPGATVPGSPTTVPPTTELPAVVPMAAFPVQGPCWYTDTWQAPRGGGRRHEGVDVIARSGLYLYAVVDGTLTRQALDRPGSLSGNAWWLTADDGTYFFYAHLAAFAPGLQVGSRVKAGQVIGWVGRTGNASSAHLHFEIHPQGGRAINPTASIRATDACRVTTPLPQPDGAAPPTMPAVPTPPPSSTTQPGTTQPGITQPGITQPGGAPIVTAPSAPLVAGTKWQFMAPKTAYDSAWGSTPLPGQTAQKIRVDQLSGVPAGTTGVVLRLTAQSVGLPGYLATYPCDLASAPSVSQLTYGAGETAVGTSIAEVVQGSICLFTSTNANVKVEVLAAQAATGVGVQPINATRVADTRTTGRLGAGSRLTLTPGLLGATTATQAVTATITLVGPAAGGTLSLGFCGQGPWQTPFTSDSISSFSITMRVTSVGLCLSSSVDTDVIVDVTAVWGGSTAPIAIDPARIFDSRAAGSPVWTAPVTVPIIGLPGVPSGATTALLSITTVSGEKATSVFAVPCGEGRGTGAVAAQSAYRVSSEVVAVRLGGGAVCISSIQPTNVIVDLIGAA
jgi:LysM repeat protein